MPGELYIGGDGVSLGYLGRPELTQETFISNPFSGQADQRLYRTGDAAKYRADGNIIILGRLDNQVKIRGFRIEIGEVEAAIGRCPGIRENVVTVAEDQTGLSRLAAYFTLDASDDAMQDWKRKIRARLREVLPEYMVPTTFMLLDELPRTPNGKIDRKALPEPVTAPDPAETEFEAPIGATERTLAQIWGRVLRTTGIGRRDDFFLLGGHSLLAVQLFNSIEEEFSCRLPLPTLLSAPTLELLARAVDSTRADLRGQAGPDWSVLVRVQPDGDRVPLFCVHGAGGNVLLYRELVRNLGTDYPFYGLQSKGLDGQQPPLPTVEDMADVYLEQIRRVRPSGPYCLGGYCMGGMVAFEMARRLQQDGESVPLVALMDTYNLSLALEANSRGFLFQKLRFHMGNLASLEPSEMTKYLQEKVRVARDGELSSLLGQLFGAANPHDKPDTEVELSVQSANDRAAFSFKPKPFSGTLTLFKPNVNYSVFPDPKMGWGEVALGGMEIVNLPVNPHGMLVEPFVVHLAREMRRRIDVLVE